MIDQRLEMRRMKMNALLTLLISPLILAAVMEPILIEFIVFDSLCFSLKFRFYSHRAESDECVCSPA